MSNQVVKKNNSRFSFVGETITELKKVTWLSRREALYLTGLVLLVAVTVGAILGAIDFGFSFIVDNFIIGN